MGGEWSRCQEGIVWVLRFDRFVIPLAFVGKTSPGGSGLHTILIPGRRFAGLGDWHGECWL